MLVAAVLLCRWSCVQ